MQQLTAHVPSQIGLKGRFLLFQVYRNFANLFSKLSVSTFYKLISKFQQIVQSSKNQISRFARDSLTLLRTSVSTILSFAKT